ncbi:MAG TPA: DegT/DnrJ/EryC1/StrS family aminotransferase [Pyrinomonadaceae bacterium]|jgi:perosamine synthetase|nr:DegT/DnrJ/EryC1/StrS family aminotransferase [Pyrinomonadaceae bacterium]
MPGREGEAGGFAPHHSALRDVDDSLPRSVDDPPLRAVDSSPPRAQVPFFRPRIGEREVEEVVATLRSGWLTTGARVKRFEQEFAASVGAEHAVAVNSCTAALHLAVEALGLRAGQAVLVPAMTFAATAEVVRYQGALPVLVDCDPVTTNMSLEDAGRKLARLSEGWVPDGTAWKSSPEKPSPGKLSVVGIMPVHVGGLMLDAGAVKEFAARHGLWIVEDAAHAFPAAWRGVAGSAWQRCGEGTAEVSCFSFYANKTITTGEGGMATTNDARLAERMRLMSLHGLSHDAWERYSGGGSWDYRIIAPGYKYNLTDIAAAVGIHQLARAEEMRRERERIARFYAGELAEVEEIELPPTDANRVHAWHLFPIKLNLARLSIDRNAFVEELKGAGVGCSVHWRPLHLHPYYRETFGWTPQDCPAATDVWERLISLPIFPGMRDEELAHVAGTVKNICARRQR